MVTVCVVLGTVFLFNCLLGSQSPAMSVEYTRTGYVLQTCNLSHELTLSTDAKELISDFLTRNALEKERGGGGESGGAGPSKQKRKVATKISFLCLLSVHFHQKTQKTKKRQISHTPLHTCPTSNARVNSTGDNRVGQGDGVRASIKLSHGSPQCR